MNGHLFHKACRIAAAAGLALALQLMAVTAAAAQSSIKNFPGVNADYSISPHALKYSNPHSTSYGSKGGPKGPNGHGGVPGIDSLQNWVGSFNTRGFDPNNNPQTTWPFSMVGQAPQTNQTTVFRAPVIPVTVVMLDSKGNIAKASNGTPLVDRVPDSVSDAVLQSPIFESYNFFTGNTQFTDAQMRSEFWNQINHNDGGWGGGWHNLLNAQQMQTRTIQLPYGSYAYALNTDGSCCVLVLTDVNLFISLLFPPTYPVDNSTPIGAAELAGDMTTKDITTFLFKDLYLTETIGSETLCCIIGFHAYDQEPGAKTGALPRLYVMMYASWISEGLFSGDFEDITALSHEMAETFNDPFTNNITPWWLSQDPVTGNANCQDDLEVGDVVEVLSTTAPVFAAQTNGRTYHPQNVAQFSWFLFQSPSAAQNGSYAFPDETTLTSLSPGPLLGPNCTSPP